MNKFLWALLNIFFIFFGVSFVLFVFRMIWMPPNSMGMMMNRNMMINHMNFWLKGTFIVFIIFGIILFVIGVFMKQNKRDK